MVFHVDARKRRRICRNVSIATTYRSHTWDRVFIIIAILTIDVSFFLTMWNLVHGRGALVPLVAFVVSVALYLAFFFVLCVGPSRVGEALKIDDGTLTYRYVNDSGSQVSYVAQLDKCDATYEDGVIFIKVRSDGAITANGEPAHCICLFDWFEPDLCDVLGL